MGYDQDKELLNTVAIQSQNLNVGFIVDVFKSVLEYSLLLGCLYGVITLLVELHELI